MSDFLKGLGYYIPPELRNLGSNINQLARFLRTPDPRISYKNLMTSTANTRLPALGTYASDLAAFLADAGLLRGSGRVISKTSEFGGKVGKSIDEKIADLVNKIGSKKATKAEEILKDLDDETLMLTKPDDLINVLNEGGLEGKISSNVAQNIKNLIFNNLSKESDTC